MTTVPAAAATTVSPRSASAVLPRLKSISYDLCALLLLELPVHVWPQGNGSWKLGAARVETGGTSTWFAGLPISPSSSFEEDVGDGVGAAHAVAIGPVVRL